MIQDVSSKSSSENSSIGLHDTFESSSDLVKLYCCAVEFSKIMEGILTLEKTLQPLSSLYTVNSTGEASVSLEPFSRIEELLQQIRLGIERIQKKKLDRKNSIAQSRIAELYRLSPREIKVLEFLHRGEARIDIAEKLYVSLNTIKTHIKNIYFKTNVSCRDELLKLFEEQGDI